MNGSSHFHVQNVDIAIAGYKLPQDVIVGVDASEVHGGNTVIVCGFLMNRNRFELWEKLTFFVILQDMVVQLIKTIV